MYISHRKNVRDITAKIVILGEPGVGKTSIRKRYMGEGFKASYLPTLGADFAINKLEFENGWILQANIWDLAGQESYDRVIRYYLQNTDAAIIVFDLTRLHTFERLSYWFGKLAEADLWPHKKIPIIILGNKSDLEKSEVSEIHVSNFLRDLVLGIEGQTDAIKFLETSAKNGMNVPLAFENIGMQILNKINKFR